MVVAPADFDELPVFYWTEQPETCRNCGARTNFDVLPNGLQVHQ